MNTCSCQGENENCYKCGGKGYLTESDLAPTRLVSFKRGGQRRSSRRGRKGISTRISKQEPSSVRQLPSFQSLAQGALKQQAAPVPVSTPPALMNSLVQCPRCPSMVKHSNLQRHLRRTHSTPESPAPKSARQSPGPKPAPSSVSSSAPVKCPHCPAMVKPSRLKGHCLRVHGAKASENPQHSAGRSPDAVRNGNPDATDGNRILRPPPKHLDATYAVGGTYRDHNRFGGHASHDGFDDESAP